MGDPADADQDEARSDLERLVQQIIERLVQEGYVTAQPDLEGEREHREQAQGEGPGLDASVRFEITDKGLDFLGYRALRDLLGTTGKSSFGRHDTRDLATGIESSGATKPYEFGDTLNLDASGTILNAVRRDGLATGGRAPGDPAIDVQYEDLVVAQGEYQSSCATVLMLDCSHSMILYGEDRFTPAKRVALALANLIRTEYPATRSRSSSSTTRPRRSRSPSSRGCALARTTPTPARACASRAACSSASRRTCGRS